MKKVTVTADGARIESQPDWAVGVPVYPGKWDLYKHNGIEYLEIRGNDGAWRYVPVQVGACSECDGSGTVTCEYDHEHECPECDGAGLTDDVKPSWGDAIEHDEFHRMLAQERWLEKRYGTTHPASIVDYWIPQG